MYLPYSATDSWSIVPHNNKQVFRDVSHVGIYLYNFDMGKPLAVRANFVLALDNQYSAIPQNPIGFLPCTFL